MLGRWCLSTPPDPATRSTSSLVSWRPPQADAAFVVDSDDATGSISVLRSDFGDLEFAAVTRAWKSSRGIRLVSGDSCTLFYARSEALRPLAERLRRRFDSFVSSSSMIRMAGDRPTIRCGFRVGHSDVVEAGRRGADASAFFQRRPFGSRAAEREMARQPRAVS